MAHVQSAVADLLEAFRAGEGVDLVRESVRIVLQELIDTEATAVIGAERYERSPERTTERNGVRLRELMTKGGTVEVAIPKLRKGSFFPSVLEARRRIDQALYAVVMEAWVNGVSTRSVDDLVVALGGSGISKSEVSRICAALDERSAGSGPGAWTRSSTRTCSWMLPTCMSVTTDLSPAKRSWSQQLWPRTVAARSSASTSAIVKTKCSGAASSPH